MSLEAFFHHGVDLMAVVDADLIIIEHNAAVERHHGTLRESSVLELAAPKERERIRLALEQALHGAPRTFDGAVVRQNQTLRSAEWTVASADQKLYVTIRDTTSRLRLEKELAQAQKLEAIGQLASGIAHEINTPVQFIGDNLSFIEESVGHLTAVLRSLEGAPGWREAIDAREGLDLPFLYEELPGALSQSKDGVRRVAELVRGMKEFAHPDRGEVAPTNLNRDLERTITVSRNEWKYAADLVCEFDESLPVVPCQASAMRQVFLNLICNAGYAVRERNTRSGRVRGRITVSTRREGEFALISVRDDGDGIPDQARPHLFEPFFTTKPVGKGTGQGLAISRTIVCSKHGGRLDFETESQVGTVFHVRLPLTHP